MLVYIVCVTVHMALIYGMASPYIWCCNLTHYIYTSSHIRLFCYLDCRTLTLPQCILELKNLTMLYLHGNNIGRIADVDKLSRLGRLKTLTLHGNPIESNAGYRQYIICHLPQLLTFDFSGITKSDRATADTWRTMIAPPPKKGKRKTETAE